MALADFITLAELREIPSIPQAAEETFLGSLIDAATKRIRNITHQSFDSQTVTEYHDGRGASYVILGELPIASVTSVHDDPDRDYDAAHLVAAADYTFYPNEGRIQLEAGIFQNSLRNVKVIYVAGYAAIPDDVKLACRMLCSFWYNRGKEGAEGFVSESLGVRSISWSAAPVPEAVMDILDHYIDRSV